EKLPYAKANDAQWLPQVLGGGPGQERVHWHSSRTLHTSRTSAHVDLEQWNATAAADEEGGAEAPALPRRCTVLPGDALFLPAYWHQQRRSFGGPDAGARCGCVDAAVDFWYRAPPRYTRSRRPPRRRRRRWRGRRSSDSPRRGGRTPPRAAAERPPAAARRA
ncbi:unnamed protein product, partial [Prorocentrum cordatum]